MKTRIITAIVAIPLLVVALLQPFAEVWGVIALLASIIGLYEFYKATGIKKSRPLCIMGYIAAIYFIAWTFYPRIAIVPFSIWFPGILCILMLMFNQKINANMLGMTILSVLYIPYLLTHIILLRKLSGGEYYIWLILIAAFLTDTCAYFVGKGLGKHKLCPNLSPNKTVEGAIGGACGCGLFCMLFGLIISKAFGADVHFLKLFIMGLLCSVAAQCGDLTASAIKRQNGIKDYGHLFPGHGGILDRIDSILFVAPVMYYYIVFIGILG